MSECKYINLRRLLFCVLFITFSVSSVAQVWNKPVLNFSDACATRGVFNEFSVDVSYSSDPFVDPNNRFILELSDPDGSFDDPDGITILRSGIQENSFSFSINFALIEGIYGQNYKIRVKSTHPEKISPESDAFGAYFLPSSRPSLNDGTANVFLCNASETKEIAITFNDGVTDPDEFEYQWYFNENPYQVGGSKITVNQEGTYYADIIAGGSCSVVSSSFVFVTVFEGLDVEINSGETSASICANETFTFTTDVDEPSYTYNWYKDGVLITGLPNYSPTYTTPDSDQFGTYFLEIDSGNGNGCKNKSQEFVLSQKTEGGFEVNVLGADVQVVLPNVPIELVSEVSVSSPSYTYQWFKDGEALIGKTRASMYAEFEGVYYVEVTDESSSCAVSAVSPEVTILGVDKLATTIRTGTDYAECESTETVLSVVGVKVEATDGEEYDLTADQVEALQYQWLYNDVVIAGATQKEYKVESYQQNGEYSLQISLGGLPSSKSEELTVSLVSSELGIISFSESNTLCPGVPILLGTIDVPGYTHQWFKDGELIETQTPISAEVNEAATYTLISEGFGCSVENSVEIIDFDASVLEVSPSTTAILLPGEATVLTASGADSYEWFDSNGTLLSTNETLEVSSLGTFKLVGTVGTCRAEKEVRVVEDDGSFVIPNVLTPFNGDGVNDTWKLPNKFAFQPSVKVIVFTSNGKEVLNTSDYQNNWPQRNTLRGGMIFYFKVIKEGSLIKAGTISVLE